MCWYRNRCTDIGVVFTVINVISCVLVRSHTPFEKFRVAGFFSLAPHTVGGRGGATLQTGVGGDWGEMKGGRGEAEGTQPLVLPSDQCNLCSNLFTCVCGRRVGADDEW